MVPPPGSPSVTPFIPPLSTPEGRTPPMPPVIPGSTGGTPSWGSHPVTPGHYPTYPPTPYNTSPFIPQMSVHGTPAAVPGSYFPPPTSLPPTGPPANNLLSGDYTGYPQYDPPNQNWGPPPPPATYAPGPGWGPPGWGAPQPQYPPFQTPHLGPSHPLGMGPMGMGGPGMGGPGMGGPGMMGPGMMGPGMGGAGMGGHGMGGHGMGGPGMGGPGMGGPGMGGPGMGGHGMGGHGMGPGMGGPGMGWGPPPPPFQTPGPGFGGPQLWPPASHWNPGQGIPDSRLMLGERFDKIDPFAVGKHCRYFPFLFLVYFF
jgi:hypothetical protein